MSDLDLEGRFPEMRPILSAPALFTLNGCGCSLHGVRDYDEETGTYVKTQCVCLVFLPIFFLRAYRVADADTGGWYFLGRVPLAPLAKCWNGFFLVALLALAGYCAWEATRIKEFEPIAARNEKAEDGTTVCVQGEVVDKETGRPIPARIYLQNDEGVWYFPTSAAPEGSAVPYKKRRSGKSKSLEMHVTLSAHPFVVDLPPGKYILSAERGKEYLPYTRQFTVGQEELRLRIELARWIDLGALGWFSGDTHVHRGLEELPNVMLAEDLNVAFPLLHWVTEAYVSPRAGPQGPALPEEPKVIAVDATHAIYPRNTEYEIFTVGKKEHALGAFLALNHKTVLEEGVPPVRAVAQRIHREGGLIELDKHCWPWSMMLVPVMQADLYELSNNHVWRTEFGFPGFGAAPAEYMHVERDGAGFTEAGWIDYGLQNYYALLNCGFRLRPSAGTAAGVHPVPLGFGRVYVHLPDGFSYDAWVRGLNEGRSFVTTGPMLFVKVNGQDPGHVFQQNEKGARTYRVTGAAVHAQPLRRIEILVNGSVVKTVKPHNRQTPRGAYESPIEEELTIEESSWLAVRCFEDRPNGRVRFAHGSPVHIEVADRPLRPRKQEVEFLIQRVEDQIARNEKLLPPAALDEYREALEAYRKIAANAR